MKGKLRIGVVFGGRSGEHEVSLVSARSVMSALDPKKYRVAGIKILKTGAWEGVSTDLKNLRKNFDVIFPVLHGTFGEDGTIQGMLEMAGLPYVGCGVLASSVAMDKYSSKMIFQTFGLPQTKFVHTTKEEIKKDFLRVSKDIAKKLGYPCFVKPSNLGSSVGISKVKKQQSLRKALEEAALYDDSIIIEKAVPEAREIEVAVLGNDDPKASVAGEIVPSREFYDYYAKYVDNASGLFIPAKISKQKMEEVRRLAVWAFRALQCSGMARVDFLMEKRTGKIHLNELNTIPGFTSISMYPKLWQASGMPYSKLLDCLIELALDRFRQKEQKKLSFESGSNWYK